MKTVCEINKCNGCMACVSVCNKNCIKIIDSMENMNCIIDEKLCVNCNKCRSVCPNNKKNKKYRPLEWKQGWTTFNTRSLSSSVGVALAIISSFIQNGGYVASCLFKDGEFIFELTNDLEMSKKFAGSKYVKSNPNGIYLKIKERLKTDKVLFIGLPCQVAAVNNYIKDKKNLYTIDLICHGTPSVKLLEKYIDEIGYDINSLNDIKFREKNNFGLVINGKKVLREGVIDHYLCSFLESINYTDNCYYCQFATFERVSDITLGDSWGTEYKEQQKKGISLILTQTKKGKEIQEAAGLELKDIDIDKAISNNHQLSRPSELTAKRKKFFYLINKGVDYKTTIFIVLGKMIIRQKIKGFLVRMHLIKLNRP